MLADAGSIALGAAVAVIGFVVVVAVCVVVLRLLTLVLPQRDAPGVHEAPDEPPGATDASAGDGSSE